MPFRALTLSREYGSGGAAIASIIAKRLGWHLVDDELIERIASAAHVDPAVVRTYDERVDTWLHRLNRQALVSTALAAGVNCSEQDFFDADRMVAFTRGVIEQAWSDGNCVIVGRGGACVLAGKPDVYRTFVYAPPRQRLERVRARAGRDFTADDVAVVDAERLRYVRTNFGCNWKAPELYDLMISSSRGDEITAAIILNAISGA